MHTYHADGSDTIPSPWNQWPEETDQRVSLVPPDDDDDDDTGDDDGDDGDEIPAERVHAALVLALRDAAALALALEDLYEDGDYVPDRGGRYGGLEGLFLRDLITVAHLTQGQASLLEGELPPDLYRLDPRLAPGGGTTAAAAVARQGLLPPDRPATVGGRDANG